MRAVGRAALGLLGYILVSTAQKKPGWQRMGEADLREAEAARERRREREANSILIALLVDRGQHDLAKVMAMRVAGRTVVIGVLQEDGSFVEVCDVP